MNDKDGKIKDIISAYKADFTRIAKDEIYKWQAVQWYKEHWNINAPDFAAMFTSAFSKAGNLLTAHRYYPYRVLCQFAEMKPEEVRAMFQDLYDEKEPLSERYLNFRSRCDTLLIEYRGSSENHSKAKNHYQDLHTISVYLSFEYPETYFIYKFKIDKGFRELTGFSAETDKNKSETKNLENYNQLYQSVLEVVNRDAELLELNRSRLGSDCYQDEAHHLLTMDIVYFAVKYMSAKKLSKSPAENTLYWPTLQEYDPHITVKQWQLVLTNKSVTTKENLAMLKMMLELGGESTCANLANVYGNTHSYYNIMGSSFGKRVQENLNCPNCYDGRKIRYFPIPFVGRSVIEDRHQRYSWKLREELKVALESMDLPDIQLVNKGKNVTDVPKNTILYGPPGTGKTYHTVIYAVAIIENKPLSEIELEPYNAVALRYHNYKMDGLIEFTTFHQSYSYEEFIEGIKPVMNVNSDGQNDISYELSSGLFKSFCESASQSIQETSKNYVFIIDEINRGNISKIFGELITLIEPTKRIGQPEEISVKLPYSQKLFGVPNNVYLIGTMNTADRSIATIDTALRRRFHFKEMPPDPGVLEGIFVEDISIQNLLSRMNLKISTLYDREHTIGHAYFTRLKENPSLEVLASIFQNNIIPLLQEYFYDDYEKIRLVLGDNNKKNEKEQFILAKATDYTLFGNTDFGMDDTFYYDINPPAFLNIEAYRSI